MLHERGLQRLPVGAQQIYADFDYQRMPVRRRFPSEIRKREGIEDQVYVNLTKTDKPMTLHDLFRPFQFPVYEERRRHIIKGNFAVSEVCLRTDTQMLIVSPEGILYPTPIPEQFFVHPLGKTSPEHRFTMGQPLALPVQPLDSFTWKVRQKDFLGLLNDFLESLNKAYPQFDISGNNQPPMTQPSSPIQRFGTLQSIQIRAHSFRKQ